MEDYEHLFSYEKAYVLNVLYDVFELLSFNIARSDSVRGRMNVFSSASPKLGGQITVLASSAAKETLVKVFPNENGEKQSEWIAALFDEVQALIRQTAKE